jgi:pimeloyl-ACP methyl ester carboxylesterase
MCWDIKRQYPHVKTYINEWGDDILGQLRATMEEAPHIVVAHSYGAAAIIRAAAKLQKEMSFARLILVDPVPRWLWGQWQWSSWTLSDNIMTATAFFQNNQVVPRSCLIQNLRAGWNNVDLTDEKVGHCSICYSKTVYDAVMNSVAIWDRWEKSTHG